ncbi:F0F1 ATP synthase subunit gamma [Castellaniella sp.]|uniref:F0F1 ATP synthase subunit gamma n=1 Tax=Castellaniella sp. TaxID=1955812 RepID=UPI003569DEC5
MAQSLEALTRQGQTLASIRGIVRTMKSLAAINAAPYEEAAMAIEAYQATIRRGFSAFAYRMRSGWQVVGAGAADPSHRIVVAFGSDHGFCGNYNELLAAEVSRLHARMSAAGRPTGGLQVLCVGARMQAALEGHGLVVAQRLLPPASVDGVARLASEVVAQIERRSRGRPLTQLGVWLAYTRRAGHGMRTPVVSRLLPLPPALLQAPDRWPSRALPDFTLAPAAQLSALVRHHLFASVFRASAEAMVTENAARLALMQQAEQSVDERLAQLGRELSAVRQDQITQEIMDIIIAHE